MLDQTSHTAGGTKAARALPSIAFGVERLGLIAMRTPITSVVILAILCVAAFFGLERIKIDNSLSQLFRSNTKEFRQYEEVTKRFPATEFDVLVVLEGKSLLARASLEKIRDLVTDIQLVDGTRGIISLFSARQAPEPGKLPAALFPEKLPEGAAYDKFIETVRTNEILRGKLLSDDGTLALIVLALDPAVVSSNRLGPVVGEIRKLLSDTVQGTDLIGQLSGVPIMQLEIRNAVARDGIIYNVAGVLAGCLIAIVFFRRISFMVIAAFPPILAILLSLGTLGWFGFSLNMFLNVMTPLIMVISFSDSMQLTFAARDRLIAGEDKVSAFRNAILVVGPACVLTHCTAGLSFVALMFSNSDLIRAFGEAGLTATVIALVAVLSLVPLFGVLLVRREQVFAEKIKAADWGVNALRAFCAWIAVRMTARPALWSAIGFLVVAGLTVVYVNLEPRYRLADQVPDKKQAVEASSRLDAKLTGANPIDVLIEFPKGKNLYDAESLQTVAEVHSTIEKTAGVGNVWSVETLRRWLAEKVGRSDVATLKEYVDLLPAYLTRRFVAEPLDAVLVSGRVPDLDSAEILPVVEKLDAALEDDAEEASGLRDRGDRTFGDRCAQQRGYDRQAQCRADGGIPVRRRIHRARLPLVRRHAGQHPAWHLPGGDVGHGVVGDRGGPAVRERGGADRVVRPGLERDNSLPQPFAAREHPGNVGGSGGRESDDPGRAGADPHHGGVGLRSRRDGILGPAVAQAVRVAERLLDGRSPDRGPVHPAANRDVPDPRRRADPRQGRPEARDIARSW